MEKTKRGKERERKIGWQKDLWVHSPNGYNQSFAQTEARHQELQVPPPSPSQVAGIKSFSQSSGIWPSVYQQESRLQAKDFSGVGFLIGALTYQTSLPAPKFIFNK